LDVRIAKGLRRKLLALRQQLKDQLSSMEAGLMNGPQSDWARELSAYDNHPADSASETYLRSQQIGLIDSRKRMLSMIETVIAKLDNGTYGLCENCQKPIPEERLQAIPFALLCKECRELAEQKAVSHLRPAEESLIRSLFSRLFGDEADSAGTDGEDTWQAVAQHGTAETYQDVAPTTGDNTPGHTYIDSDEVVGAVEEVDRVIDEERDDVHETG